MSGNEVWKDVLGYEGLYQVSNKGNVYSVGRRDALGRECGGFTLSPKLRKDGYLLVSLSKNGIKKNKYIHRMVAEAFILNPKSFLEVNHKDENKKNNELSNLEWCTPSYNVNYGKRTEKASQKLCKKVRAVNIETGEVMTFSSAKEAINKGYPSTSQACGGVYKNSSGNLIGGDGHLYRGHRWSYEE